VRKPLRDALVSLSVTVALLGLGEGATRLVLRLRNGTWPATAASLLAARLAQARQLYRVHPYLNTAPRAGARVLAFSKRASFNSLGYRSPERPLGKPPGVVRVLCSGGSTTFDLLAERDEASWPWLLEGRLRATGEPVEVWNAGFPGWTSLENLIALELRDLDLTPDLALLFQGINDLQPAAHVPFDRQYERGHAEVSRQALGFGVPPVPFWERSILLELLKNAVAGPRDPWARFQPTANRGPRRAQITGEGIAAFGRNVRSFTAVARARGVTVVLVTQTIRLRRAHRAEDLHYVAEWIPGLAPEAAPGELERLNDVLRSLAREEGVRVIDAAREAGWEDADFGDPLHFSAAGAEKLARLLAGRLPLPAPAEAARFERNP
jgi:lysophospholipase L1-like esterase